VLPQLWCGQDWWWAPHSGEPAGAAALHEGVCWCCPSCGVGRNGGGHHTQMSLQARPLSMRACGVGRTGGGRRVEGRACYKYGAWRLTFLFKPHPQVGLPSPAKSRVTKLLADPAPASHPLTDN